MRFFVRVLFVSSCLFVLSACGSDEEATAPVATTAAPVATTAAPAAAVVDEVCQGQDGSGLKVAYGDLATGIPFVTQVWENIQEVAATCNLEIVYADNNLDGETALENARTFTLQGVDGVIQFQIDQTIEGALCEELRSNDPDLPVIAIDIAHPSCALFFGANNPRAGELAGEGVGQWAKENWDCEIDMILTLETFEVGDVNVMRSNGSIRGIQNVCPDLAYGDFEEWAPAHSGSIVTRINGGGTTDSAFPLVLDTFTANPGKNIAVVSLNDDMGLAALAAAEELGIEDYVVYGSQGADATIHDTIRTNSHYVGSTAYFPESYGTYVVPAILKMINGESVEDPLLLDHLLITADNIDNYYSSDGSEAAAVVDEVCQGQDGSGLKVAYGDLATGIPFVTQVWENIQEVAATCNLEIVYADNNLDGETALENARTFTLQGVDGVIQFQIDQTIEGALCEELRSNDPDLPVIAIDIAHPSCALFFGANNPRAGELAGEGVGQWAKENWDCEIDMILTLETFEVGDVNVMRSNGSIRGIQNVCPDLAYGDFEEWAPAHSGSIVTRINGGGTTDSAFPLVLDTFTANPGKNIAVVSLNDDMGLAALAAAEELGIEDYVVYGSQGADATIHDTIRTNSHYVGSTAYFPESYGTYVVPAILKMINGESVEDPLLLDHLLITADNINNYYPAG